ncbi:MAG: hypothetical protein ACRDE2_14360 [Chitinophagaceae bacterium]
MDQLVGSVCFICCFVKFVSCLLRVLFLNQHILIISGGFLSAAIGAALGLIAW